ncbi:MAG: hypothetical protein K5859_00740 [Atopobiaceae bacterium]|nr:hypothetical protein [Atopobiaceae bacterium]
MDILRIDHLHVKGFDYEKAREAYEQLMGREFVIDLDFTDDQGTEVVYEPYPLGIELFNPTDPALTSGRLASSSKPGVFAVSYKVPDIEKGIEEMEAMGYGCIEVFDFGDIKEAIFETYETFGFYVELISYPGDSITEVYNNVE